MNYHEPVAALHSGQQTALATRGRLNARGNAVARILAAAAGGFMLQMSFAPSTWWWAAIIGLSAVILAVHGRSFWPAAGLGLIFALSFYIPLLWWTTTYVGPVATALPILEALLTAPVVALMGPATRRAGWPVLVAALWTVGETLRARAPFGGFPWGAVAFSQPDGPLLPAASLIGVPGLSFITALAAAGLAALIRTAATDRHLRVRALIVPVVAVALPFGLGLTGRMTAPSATNPESVQVAIIQGNVPQPGLEFNARRRAVTDMHAQQNALLADAVRAGIEPAPSIVIWPENSSDLDPYRNPDAYRIIDDATKNVGVPVLIGAVVRVNDSSPATYNQGIVWDPITGPGQTYTKRHPVPFAEYMPFRTFFRFFSSQVDSAGYFLPGSRPGVLDLNGTKVGDVICFEIVYDTLVSDVVRGGAKFIVVQTNNATFGYTNETYQQQAMSRVRAVEHRRQVLIAATSGVSASIGPDGRVQERIGLFQPGYINAQIPVLDDLTPATKIAGLLELLLVLSTVLSLASTVRRRLLQSLARSRDCSA